jgi:soluble lytic murein transglycosylase-like protein
MLIFLHQIINTKVDKQNTPAVLALEAAPQNSPSSTLPPTPTETIAPTPKPTRIPTKKPSPTPSPTPVKITQAELENLFEKAASHYSIEKQKLRTLAYCESRFNPTATNGIYGGLYQFSSSTWKSTRIAMNQDPNPNLRFNPEAAINTAAFKISTSGLSAWPYCSKQN